MAATDKQSQILPKDMFLLLPCMIYDMESYECTTGSYRSLQKFIYGKGAEYDCDRKKEDFKNCVAWFEKKDMNALNKVLESERQKRKVRQLSLIMNDVWNLRTQPPSDWMDPPKTPKNIPRAKET